MNGTNSVITSATRFQDREVVRNIVRRLISDPKHIVIFYVCPVGLALLVLFSPIGDALTRTVAVMLLSCGLIGPLLHYYCWIAQLCGRTYGPKHQPFATEVSEAGVREISAFGVGRDVPWRSIRRVMRYGTITIFVVRWPRWILVPDDAFKNHGDLICFRALTRTKLGFLPLPTELSFHQI